MCNFFQKSDLNPRNIDKTVSDIRIRIRFPFGRSYWISVSGSKLTNLPDIQPANRIVIISAGYAIDRSCTSVFSEPFHNGPSTQKAKQSQIGKI